MNDDEATAIQQFVDYLEMIDGAKYEFDLIAETNRHKTPDAFIKTKNILVEVKEIHDSEEVRQNAAWGGSVKRLGEIIDGHENINSVTGSFLVSTPYPFKLPSNITELETLATAIIEAATKYTKETKFTHDAMKLEFGISKYSNEGSSIAFTWDREARSINPAATIHENIVSKIVKADMQLAYQPSDGSVSKRILLLVNRYSFAMERDVIEAMSYSIDVLKKLTHIDEIWLQLPPYDDRKYNHHLVYTSSFFDELHRGEISDLNLNVFKDWFWALEKNDAWKPVISSALKNLLNDSKPHELFKNAQSRIDMLRIADWHAENGEFDDAMEIARSFINDPDPPSDFMYLKKSSESLHRDVLEGNDTIVISSVLGHLAWTIQRMTISKDHICECYMLTEKLAKHPNLYVKLQALIPLMEISRRRVWLDQCKVEEEKSLRLQLHSILFEYLEKYSQHKSIADWLARAFLNYKELSSDEAAEVLEKLDRSQNSAPLFIYYGIYRKDHFKNLKSSYDSKLLEDKLENAISNFAENPDLSANISWHMAKIVRENNEEFAKLEPWFEIMLGLPYFPEITENLSHLVKTVSSFNEPLAAKWFASILDTTYDALEKSGAERVQSIWVTPRDGMKWVAHHLPEQHSVYLEKIMSLWEKGAYIGDAWYQLKTYSEISDKQIRDLAKTVAQGIHKRLSEDNRRLADIDWP